MNASNGQANQVMNIKASYWKSLNFPLGFKLVLKATMLLILSAKP